MAPKQETDVFFNPTVRYEGDESQPEVVNEENQRLYEHCIPDIKIKYELNFFKWSIFFWAQEKEFILLQKVRRGNKPLVTVNKVVT